MKSVGSFAAGLARAAAFAFFVGAALMLLETGAAVLPALCAGGGWSWFTAPRAVYGVRGPWQLAAHKIFAYGWFVPALAIAVMIATLPVFPLYRRLGLKPGRIGVAVAAAFVLYAQLATAALAHVFSRFKTPEVYVLPFDLILPLAVAFIAALLYVLFSSAPLVAFARRRRAPLVAAALFAAAAALSFFPSAAPGPVPRGPNVLLITIDTLRADKVGPRAGGESLTPNIDRFSRGATTFRRCVSVAPWTMPSLATLHTGLYPPVHQAGMRAPLAKQSRTLAELFRRRGYDTAAVTANDLCEPVFGLARGFDNYRSFKMLSATVPTRLYYTVIPSLFLSPGKKLNATTPVVERRTLTYLDRRRRQRRPFFLWIHFFDPHWPYTPPPGFVAEKVNALRAHIDPDRASPRDKMLYEALYDGEVRYVDRAVGRILSRLDDVGLAAHTVVVITSDHGEEFWEHGGLYHGTTLYDELLLVPLIIRAPGIWPAGAVVTGQVSSVDIFATLVDFCGLTPDLPHQSRSLSRLFKEAAPASVFAFSSNADLGDAKAVAVSDGAMKLVVSPAAGTEKLYDLAADAGEQNPQADAPGAQRYRAAIAEWKEENEGLKDYYGAAVRLDPRLERQMRALGYVR